MQVGLELGRKSTSCLHLSRAGLTGMKHHARLEEITSVDSHIQGVDEESH